MARSRNFTFALFPVIIVLVGFLCIPTDIQAATIVKSKSNVSNNREAGLNQTSGPATIIVLCESCTFPGLPEESHLVLMDRLTGDMWAYSDAAVVGDADPIYVGTMSVLGKRVTKKTLSSRTQ